MLIADISYPYSCSQLTQMKVQEPVDSGRMDSTTVPPEFQTIEPLLSHMDISVNGILKLLNNLKLGKAADPDKLRPLLLKELHVLIAPITKVIFGKTLGTGEIPADW